MIGLIGASGTAKVIIDDMIGFYPKSGICIFDDNEDLIGQEFCGIPIIDKIENAHLYNYSYINCIGSTGNNEARNLVYTKLIDIKAKLYTFISKRCIIYCSWCKLSRQYKNRKKCIYRNWNNYNRRNKNRKQYNNRCRICCCKRCTSLFKGHW